MRKFTVLADALLVGSRLWIAGILLTLLAGEAAAQGYVRVGISAALAAETQFMDVDCGLAMPAALYGCGDGGDGAPLRTVGEFSATAGLELGAGYALVPAARVELQVEYRPAVPFTGRANFLAPGREQSVTAERSTLSAMLAARLELPMTSTRGLSGFRPFAGVGIGRARHRIGEMRLRFPATETIVPGGVSSARTWAVTAGAARPLGERTALELAWRYTDQGDAETGTGAGRVQWRDGSRTIPLDLAPTRTIVRHHALLLSVRRMW